MNIRQLNTQDIPLLEDFLAPYQSQCMFICSNLRTSGIEYKNETFHGEYFGFFDNLDQITGVIAHYWNGNVMMFAPKQDTLRALVLHLKDHTKRPITGILGPNEQAEFVMQELGLENLDYAINSNEGLYEIYLDDVKEWKIPSNFRVVEAQEVSKDLLISWMQSYEIEALGADQNSDLKTRAEVKAEGLRHKDCWILIENETPVSLSAFNARIEGMVQIGPVWTPPEHRNQSFAKMLVGATLIQEKDKGTQKAILFTDHPAAIKVYESIGFKRVGGYRLALLKNQSSAKK